MNKYKNKRRLKDWWNSLNKENIIPVSSILFGIVGIIGVSPFISLLNLVIEDIIAIGSVIVIIAISYIFLIKKNKNK
ncbi:hypothetical protein [Priestia megaterium]|uniref:hypothetical protein n=1 Tax=Priestia megaterium TaxID=1404 RepID=UPI00317D2C06